MDFSLDELAKIYRDEMTSKELVEIPEDFYEGVARHVSQLTFEMKHADSLRRDFLQEELRSVAFMVQEVNFARVLKAMNKTTRGQPPAPLIERERYAFSEIRQILEKLQDDLVQPAIAGKVDLTTPLEITNVLLILLTDFQEKIVGVDMRSYGPFLKGEIVSLPAPNAEMIVRHGFARKIAVKV